MAHEGHVPTIFGLPTKYVCLLVLVVQNSALVLTMRYSRVQPGPRYLSSTAVVCSELLKCIICFIVHFHEQRMNLQTFELSSPSEESSRAIPSPSYGIRRLWADVFSIQSGFLKLLVPAVLYTFQNNLQYIAATNLDAATFQVTYQCKILTTALFAVLLLRQTLTAKKWLSLFILTIGVACVQIPSGRSIKSHQGNYLLGIIAVAVACLCSGFAGVYFEKVVKTNTSTSIWIRNIQLSMGCLGIAIFGALSWDGKAIRDEGFFQNYNSLVVGTICVQAAGGLIVAMVIKYADNILKGFATSLSIILSTVASIFIFNFVLTIYFLVGSLFVFFATYLYSQPEDIRKNAAASRNMDEEASMLGGDEYDEKLTVPHVQAFRDESDLESDEESCDPYEADTRFDEQPTTRNVSLSKLHSDSVQEGKIIDEFGHID